MDGTSAFNTRMVRGRLLLLDPARGKERLMKIQQHDGVVVEVAGISARLRRAPREGVVLREEEGGARA